MRNAVALSYHSMRGLCFLAVVFAATIFTVYYVPCAVYCLLSANMVPAQVDGGAAQKGYRAVI